MPAKIHQIKPDEPDLMHGLLSVFGQAFDEESTYSSARPDADYFHKLLGSDSFIALVALESDEVIAGLTAYELKKFEQARSEIYIYDLAVAEKHRRQGIATALIIELKEIARQRGVYLIVVEADTDIEDEPAIALYSKLGKRTEVLHFDISVRAE